MEAWGLPPVTASRGWVIFVRSGRVKRSLLRYKCALSAWWRNGLKSYSPGSTGNIQRSPQTPWQCACG